ncbi:riboflavin kinase [Pseudovirgaria hyperparasitica]|uniref:Riboflavin kinase n=1 Tax=Pseudovirgaria hyperparasitica TaxID=470096 RepID=A0A6A6WBM3_9PEZI|nr:riboflavin kinase [Pseudovirgaria hyperparasitica]KAF2760248.1 riboflavin kinase [Pseudovirgaria hyperparasitica]
MPPPANRPRDEIVGSDSGPEAPFPIKLSGPVIKGFGRGSRELGIPTANIPIAGLSVGGHSTLASGVYFGWVGLDTSRSHASSRSGPEDTYPAVLSIGYNPFYKNTVRSVEVHIMHAFTTDFYHAWLNLSILGFIRPEYDYDGVDRLIEDIRTDIEVAGRSLARDGWRRWREDAWLLEFPAEEEGKKRGHL